MLSSLRLPIRHWLSPPPPIGLDLGSSQVRMLQLKAVTGRRPSLLAAAQSDVDDPRPSRPDGDDGHQHSSADGRDEPHDDRLLDRYAAPVIDLLRRGTFAGRRVVAAMPRSMVQLKTLRINTCPPNELPRVLAREARTAMGVDLTEGRHVVHFLPADPLRRGGDTHQEGLLAVIAREDVERFVAMLHGWGAEVAAIDLEPLALYRSLERFARRSRDQQDAHVLVDFGARSTRVVVGRGERISFCKSIGIGAQQMYQQVARKLGITVSDAEVLVGRLRRQGDELLRAAGLGVHAGPGEDAAWEEKARQLLDRDPIQRAVFSATRAIVEDLGREIGLCLRYHCVTFRGRRPERVCITGGLAGDLHLRASLASIVPLPVEPRRPILDLEVAPGAELRNADHPEQWTTALGLALRFAPGGLAGQVGLSREAQRAADQQQEDEAAGSEGPGGAADPADSGPAFLEPMPSSSKLPPAA